MRNWTFFIEILFYFIFPRLTRFFACTVHQFMIYISTECASLIETLSPFLNFQTNSDAKPDLGSGIPCYYSSLYSTSIGTKLRTVFFVSENMS